MLVETYKLYLLITLFSDLFTENNVKITKRKLFFKEKNVFKIEMEAKL